MNEAADFAGTSKAVAQSRDFAARLLEGIDEQTRATVVLVVSELASNAIRHAGSGFTVEIEATPDQIRITVTDRGVGAPALQRPSPSEPSGRGLRIVETLAADWGVTEHEIGKSVWVLLSSPVARDRRALPDR